MVRHERLLFLGKGTGMSLMDDRSSAIDAALDQVKPRLKNIRV